MLSFRFSPYIAVVVMETNQVLILLGFESLLMVVPFQLMIIREFFVPADNCGDDQAMFYCVHVNVKNTLTRRLGGKDCKTELWIVNSNTWFCLNV